MIVTTDTIFAAMDKYGPVVVIIGVFILILIFMIKSNTKTLSKFQSEIIKNDDEYRKAIINSNAELVEQILNITKEKDNQNRLEKDLLDTFSKLRSSLKYNCSDTMDKIRACRLAIYLFHNGTHSTHGISFFKLSCICEKVLVGSGIRERFMEHNNIPVNLFDNMIEELGSNGSYIIKNSDSLKNSNHRIFISSKKILYSQAVAIFDSNNNILGFVLAEIDRSYDETLANDEKRELKILVDQIVPILSCLDYVDTNIDINKRQHE